MGWVTGQIQKHPNIALAVITLLLLGLVYLQFYGPLGADKQRPGGKKKKDPPPQTNHASEDSDDPTVAETKKLISKINSA